MPKRKREDAENEGAQPRKYGGIKQQRVEHKLDHGVKRVAHAFKLAKGFERQKLSRRRKTATAQKKPQDVERIDTEIVALKALDHAAAAQQHVYKSLLKIKAVAEHEDLPAQVKKPAAKVTDAPTLNVVARLCKSNQAKEALAPAIADVQNALGLEGGNMTGKKRERAKHYEEEEKSAKGPGAASKSAKVSKKESLPVASRLAAEDDDEDDDFAGYEDRLASSDDGNGGLKIAESDDDGSDSDQSIGALERQLESEGIRLEGRRPAAKGYNHEADLSLSGAESDLPSASPEPQKAPAVKRSAFLPTLTMGGYISGSGSDIEEDIDTAPKKNRRGQRARQQLAEKKYGSKAKHLQKDSRNAGWDAKHGATNGTERYGRGRMNGSSKRKYDGGTSNQVTTRAASGDAAGQKKKHRDDGGAIHPSWEAAKKAKEKKEAPIAFQGKKITFD